MSVTSFSVLAVAAVIVSGTAAGPALAAAMSTEVAVGGSSVAGDHPVKPVSSNLVFGAATTDGGYASVSCQLSMDTSVPASRSRVRSGPDVLNIARFTPKVVFPIASSCASTGGYRAVDLGTVTMTRVGGTVTASRADVVPVEVALRFVVPAAHGGGCSFVVSGSAPGTYDEGTQVLTLGTPGGSEDLLVTDVEQCSDLAEGSRARIGRWGVEVTSVDGKINMRP